MPHCVHCGKELSADVTYCPACGRPAARAAVARSGSSRAVWIAIGAGCLVLAVIFGGILTAIFVPNFLDALHKAKQKRTVADLRILGAAIESYRIEEGGVPSADSVAGLVPDLVPTYLEELPETDGWENRIHYACWSEDPAVAGCSTYRLVSGGRDGVLEHEDPRAYSEEVFVPTDYDRDVVLADGSFLQYPEGTR